MNASPPLIEGIERALGTSIPIVGAGLVGDYDFGPTRQFCGSFVGQQTVVGALLGGNLEPYFQIMHGCTVMDGIYHTITKMQGPIIYEIDGKPVAEMIDEMVRQPELAEPASCETPHHWGELSREVQRL